MNKLKYIIGIDPDVDKSGLAMLDLTSRVVYIADYKFPLLLDKINEIFNEKKTDVLIVVEAGWLNKKSCYHDAQGQKQKEKIAKNVGSNHEAGRKIIEMLTHYGYDVCAKSPLIKMWKGGDRKITHDELFQVVNGKIQDLDSGKPRKISNPEERDAALIAWDYAGFPIRIRVEKRNK